MKNLKLVLASVAFAASVAAADPTGRWTAEFRGPQGNPVRSVLTLRAEGENLTGTEEGVRGDRSPIAEGKIEGNDLTFTVVRHWQGVDFKTIYHGVLNRNVIHFRVTREDREGPAQTLEFDAKRSS